MRSSGLCCARARARARTHTHTHRHCQPLPASQQAALPVAAHSHRNSSTCPDAPNEKALLPSKPGLWPLERTCSGPLACDVEILVQIVLGKQGGALQRAVKPVLHANLGQVHRRGVADVAHPAGAARRGMAGGVCVWRGVCVCVCVRRGVCVCAAWCAVCAAPCSSRLPLHILRRRMGAKVQIAGGSCGVHVVRGHRQGCNLAAPAGEGRPAGLLAAAALPAPT